MIGTMNQRWHAMDTQEVLQSLETGLSGLTVPADPEALSSGYGNSGDWGAKNGQTKFETLDSTTV